MSHGDGEERGGIGKRKKAPWETQGAVRGRGGG